MVKCTLHKTYHINHFLSVHFTSQGYSHWCGILRTFSFCKIEKLSIQPFCKRNLNAKCFISSASHHNNCNTPILCRIYFQELLPTSWPGCSCSTQKEILVDKMSLQSFQDLAGICRRWKMTMGSSSQAGPLTGFEALNAKSYCCRRDLSTSKSCCCPSVLFFPLPICLLCCQSLPAPVALLCR
jgi:hypothetical protein